LRNQNISFILKKTNQGQMKKILFLALLMASAGQALWAQGPWMRAKGTYYTQLSLSSISNYNSVYVDGDQKLKLPRELSDRTISFYGEYGLTDLWTLKVAVPFKMLSSGDAVEELLLPDGEALLDKADKTGLGNVEIGVSRELKRGGKLLLSAHSLIKLPVAELDDDNLDGLATGYNAFTWQNGLSTGGGFGNLYFYLYGGYGLRTNDYSSYVDLSGELGYKLREGIFVALHTEMVKSMEDGNVVLPISQNLTRLYANDQEFFAGTLKFFAGLKNGFGATLGFTAFNMSGNNVARQGAMSLGVVYEMK
jgi:hypothetical protein